MKGSCYKCLREGHITKESQQEIHMVAFGSIHTKSIKTKTTTLQIRMKNGTYLSIIANIVPNIITGTIHRKSFQSVSNKSFSDLTRNLVLADTIPERNELLSLDLLVCNDYYLDILAIELEKIEIQKVLYICCRLSYDGSYREEQTNIQDLAKLMSTC